VALVAGVVWAAPAGGAAVELRAVETLRSPSGPVVRLVLSGRSRVIVRDVAGSAGGASRLYVDLPPGTRLGPGVTGSAVAVSPITELRAGIGDGGVPRVVIALDPAAAYRVEEGARDVRIAITAAADGRTVPRPGAARRRPAALLGPKIVIDAGHGGDDPGATGHAIEKDVTLAIATHLARLLRARLGADAILTRHGDTTLSLADRTARANAAAADLFLSIHANASPDPELRGVETYYLNNTDDRATNRLAAMENGLDLIAPTRGETDLRYILSSLVQGGKMEESIALAGALQRGLVAGLRSRWPDVTDLGVKRGPFYVLVGAYMPCALVETSFLTHRDEGRRLAGRAYQAAVAEGLYDGIASFLRDGRRAPTL
jgi:N-acetylmuramoyl-L-alanine amidase